MSLEDDAAGIAGSSSTWVGAASRVLAAGTTETNRLRLTLLLTPDPRVDASEGAVDLRLWPSRIWSRLRGSGTVRVQINPIESQDDLCDATRLSGIAAVEADLSEISWSADEIDRSLGDLWRRSLDRGGYGWAAIEENLSASLDGSGVGVADALDERAGEPDDDFFGPQGELTPGETAGSATVASVLNVPHSRVAVEIEKTRAFEALSAMNTPRADLGALPTPPDDAWNLPDDPDEPASGNLLREIRRERWEDHNDALRDNRARAASAFQEPANGTACVAIETSDIRSAPDDGAMSEARAAHAQATWPQHDKAVINADGTEPTLRPAPPETLDCNAEPDEKMQKEAAAASFMAIQSSANYARAFALTFDLSMPVSAFPDPTDGPVYVLLSCKTDEAPFLLPQKDGAPQFWTIAKLERTANGLHFWPATRSEVDAHLRGELESIAPYLEQFDGLMPLGSNICDAESGLYHPRFTISNTDVRSAVEQSEMQDAAGDERPGARLRSEGVTLLDRFAQPALARRMARRQSCLDGTACVECPNEGTRHLVLDALDLTIGYRLNVGVPCPDRGTKWLPLMNRDVKLGTDDRVQAGALEDVLTGLSLQTQSTARRALDAAHLTQPFRMIPRPAPDGTETIGAAIEAVVDEAIANWTGDPMGLDCAKVQDVPASDELGHGRELDLPTHGGDDGQNSAEDPDSHDLPPFQHLNLAVRFAMPAVFSGGRSVSHREMPHDRTAPSALSVDQCETRTAAADFLFAPAGRAICDCEAARPFVRVLRPESVSPPEVLLPDVHSRRTYVVGAGGRLQATDAEGVCGPIGFEAASDMLVRSVLDENGTAMATNSSNLRLTSRAAPDLVQRLIVPPTLPFDAVMRAGVFDATSSETPEGAFSGLELFCDVGFPKVETEVQEGPDGVAYAAGRKSQSSEDDTGGDSVWRERARPQPTGYYPDPAADFLVLAMRRAGRTDYLHSGAPVCLPIADGRTYPDFAPVLISVSRLLEPREGPLTLQSAILDGAPFFRRVGVEPGRIGDIRRRGDNVLSLELALAPGEDVEIDLWCLPSIMRLAREFSIVQTMATLHDSGSDWLGPLACAELSEAAQDREFAYIGTDGKPTASAGQIREMARVIHRHMACEPLPQVSGVRTLRATHAVNRVPGKPRGASSDPLATFSRSIWQRSQDDDGPEPIVALRPDAPGAGAENAAPVTPPSLPVLQRGTQHFILAGDVEIDTEGNSAVEVVATCTHPGDSNFDLRERGRSTAKRQSGIWQKLRDSDGVVLLDEFDNERLVPAESVFGFKLAADGRFQLPTSETVLLRAENLPIGVNSVALENFFLPELRDDVRVTSAHVFPDGKARRLSLQVNAISRTADRMRTVARKASDNDPWASKPTGLVLSRPPDLVRAEGLAPTDQTNLSDPIDCILPATKRPAKCDSNGVSFTFDWSREETPEAITIIRRTGVKLRLARPWFSSGENERVGIIVWPPDLTASTDAAETNLGPAPLSAAERGENTHSIRKPGRNGAQTADDARLISLERLRTGGRGEDVKTLAFSDEDLGPGGRFVTRWGADPVRDGGTERRIMPPLTAFPDLFRQEDDPKRAVYVPYVSIPLEDPVGEPQGAHGTGGATSASLEQEQSISTESVPPLAAGLVVYTPRFDANDEEWYVDLTPGTARVAEPFWRIGMVRYQSWTSPDLRASPPVVVWAQPLPERRMVVRAGARDDTALTVFVKIEGPASHKRLGPRPLPGMVCRVFADSCAGGRVLRRQIPLDCDENLEPSIEDNWATWEFELCVPLNKGVPSIEVEEVETHLRSSFEQEPVGPGMAQGLLESEVDESEVTRQTGPRFCARADLRVFLDQSEP